MALGGRAHGDAPGQVPTLPAVTMAQLLGRPGFLCRNSLRGDLTLQMPPHGSPLSLANTSSQPHTPTASKSPPQMSQTHVTSSYAMFPARNDLAEPLTTVRPNLSWGDLL